MSASRILKLTNRGQIQLYSNTQFKAALRASAGMAGDYSWDLPSADAVGYLASNGSGQLQFLPGTFNNQSMDDTYNFGHVITADAGAVSIIGSGGLQVSGKSVFKAGPWYDVTHPEFGAVAGNDCTAPILAADAAAPAGATLFFPDNVSPYKLNAGAWKIVADRNLLAFGGATIQALPGTLIGQPLIAVGDGSHAVSKFSCLGLNLDGNYQAAGPTSITVGSITGGPYLNGETITGGTSGATGQMLANASGSPLSFQPVNGTFQSGEVITGGTSGAHGTSTGAPTNNGDLGANASSSCLNLWNVRMGWVNGCYIYNAPGDCITFDYGTESDLNQGLWITNNHLGSCYRCNVAYVGGRKCFIQNNWMENYSQAGIDVEANGAGQTSSRVVISGNQIFPSATRLNPYNSNRPYGIALNSPSVGTEHMHARICGNYIEGLTDAGSQYPVAGIFISKFKTFSVIGNDIYKTRLGINAISGNTDPGSSGEVIGNHVDGCSDIGIGVMYGITVEGNTVENGITSGIQLYHTKNICTGNTCRNHGSNGIQVDGNENIIAHNECYDDTGPGGQVYGIYMADGVVLNKVEHNNVRGNLTRGIRVPAAISTNEIRYNQGFKTEASGSGSIANTFVQTQITHGLDWTPLNHDILVHPSNQTTNNIGYWFITGITSTTFLVNVRLDPGASGFSFDWSVRARV